MSAIPDAGGGNDGLAMVANAQAPNFLAEMASKSLGVPIRMVATRQGGSFGAKFSILKYMVIIGFAALYFREPVKWAETRTEHLLASNSSGPERKFKIRAHYRDSGEILALDSSVWEDVGGTSAGAARR